MSWICHIERRTYTHAYNGNTTTTISKIWFNLFRQVIHIYQRVYTPCVIPGYDWPDKSQVATMGLTEYKYHWVVEKIK